MSRRRAGGAASTRGTGATLAGVALVAIGACSAPQQARAPAPPPAETVAVDAARLVVRESAGIGEREARAEAQRSVARALAVPVALDVVALAGAIEPPGRAEPQTCSYSTYSWSTTQRRAVNREWIEKDYADVTDDERSPDDPRCSVCTEDQVTVDPAAHGWPELGPFDVCWAYADAVGEALEAIAADGSFTIREAVGYRAGRTRGAVVDGLRTEWSNHSFGTAIDINASNNGLYRSCNIRPLTAENIAQCRLGVGGAWRPDAAPSVSITRDGVVYRAFVEGVGWQWGGEIAGSTKDLMHFSLTGY